jgi:hypothetical protein
VVVLVAFGGDYVLLWDDILGASSLGLGSGRVYDVACSTTLFLRELLFRILVLRKGTYSAGVLAIDRLSCNPLADDGAIGITVSVLGPLVKWEAIV